MVEVDTVLLKVASRCNIDCRYCYVYNMGDTGWSRTPKRMSRETCGAVASALARLACEQGRPFAVVLHGGEPLLLGGMTLQRWHDSNGYDNPSVYCEDQKLLIGHIREKVASLGAIL